MKYSKCKKLIGTAISLCMAVILCTPAAFSAAAESGGKAALYEYSEGAQPQGDGIKMSDTASASWRFSLPQAGDYIMNVEFLPSDSNSSSIEQKILIDGAAPYEDMTYISYPRSYSQAEISEKDLSGNDIKPENTQITEMTEYTVTDPSGYHGSPCPFTLSQGEHTLTLTGLSGSIIINGISFELYEAPSSYSETVKNISPDKIDFSLTLEAEAPYRKSSVTLDPVTDRSSYQTSPQDSVVLKLNSIGGTDWQTVGQTLTYKFEVPQDGYYTIGMRYLQNFVDGAFVTRRLTVDGNIPFEEAQALRFYYNRDWQSENLGNSDGDYLFYLKKGEHTLTLEAVLGDFSETLGTIQSMLTELNKIYREILLVTGSEPDIYRDYALSESIPETIEKIGTLHAQAADVLSSLKELTGSNSSYTSIFSKLSNQLEMMYDDPEVNIPEMLSQFKTNLGTLGTWILDALEQPLQLDTITIAGYGGDNAAKKDNFLLEAAFQVRCFLASFIQDYDNIGVSADTEYSDTIDVWVPTGRDQAQIIRRLADAGYAREQGVQVNLKLVSAGNLLPSVVAGNGPDVYLSADGSVPIDFALRKAVLALNNFEDFNQVCERFSAASLVPYTYNCKTYALPETLTFPMFFYRTDIFEELGIKAPETFEDFMKIIPIIQSKNMNVGVDINTFYILLYSYGGSVYSEDYTASALSSDAALTAFSEYTELFTLYQLPASYDFANRFRTGEMPCGIVPYTTYNQLAVFAPEIKGQWEFIPVPGTKQDDGTVKHISIAGGTSCIIMADTDKPELSWEFLKWWTSSSTQSEYGLSMESILGESAKQPTANIEALTQMNWNSGEYTNLIRQIDDLEAVPQVPGGYYAGRIINFAFQKVYNDRTDPETTLKDYLPELNTELERKYKEFFE